MHRWFTFSVLMLTIALALVGAPPVGGAERAAGIAGRVVDRAGDPVPGAQITLVVPTTGETLALVADENGRFQSPRLPAGPVTLTAALKGDDRAARLEVQAVDGRTITVELALDVDLMVERAEVRAVVPQSSVEAREIRESFARDVGESLLRVEGLDRIRKGAIANDVVVRGFKADDVVLTIDGAGLFGACPNRMDPPAFHVDFAEIERIDVVKGPHDVSSAGGLGGAVRIITREPDPGPHAGVQLAGGSFGYAAPSLQASFAGPEMSVRGGYSTRRQDPYEDGDGQEFIARANYAATAADVRAFDVSTGWAGLTAQLRPGQRIEVQGTLQRANEVLYPYLLMDAEFDNADRFQLAYAAEAPASWLDQLDAAVSWSAVDHWMTDALRTSAGTAPRGYSMATQADSSVGEARVGLTMGPFRVGVEASRRGWDAVNEMFQAAAGSYRVQYPIPDVETRSTGLFVRTEAAAGAELDWTAGLRVDYARSEADAARAPTNLYYAYHGTRATSRSDTLTAANAGVRWRPSSPWQLSAGVGTSSRVPNAEELYYGLQRMNADWVGDPELAAPRNTQIDAEARFRGEHVSVEMSLYHGWVDDFITVYDQDRLETVPGVPSPQARSYANVDARIRGAEATVRWALADRWIFSLGGAYTRGTQDPDPARNIRSENLPEMPPLRGRFTARYQTGGWFGEFETAAAHTQDRINQDLQESPAPGWAVIHLRGGIPLGPVSAVLGIENVLDTFYRESLSYFRDPYRIGLPVYEPGRTILMSVQWRI